ncbi:hypothetical protein ACNF5J_01290 [Fannyhessea vaginae]|uniref:hypothetical protein n=1 Tax=Fannyhessea vaginae TaxID=82135 RepID=UPI003A809388
MVTGELTYKVKIYSLDPQEGFVLVNDIPIRHTQAYEDGAFAFFKAKKHSSITAFHGEYLTIFEILFLLNVRKLI